MNLSLATIRAVLKSELETQVHSALSVNSRAALRVALSADQSEVLALVLLIQRFESYGSKKVNGVQVNDGEAIEADAILLVTIVGEDGRIVSRLAFTFNVINPCHGQWPWAKH